MVTPERADKEIATLTERRLLLLQNKEHAQAQIAALTQQVALIQREIDGTDGQLSVWVSFKEPGA